MTLQIYKLIGYKGLLKIEVQKKDYIMLLHKMYIGKQVRFYFNVVEMKLRYSTKKVEFEFKYDACQNVNIPKTKEEFKHVK